LVVNVTDDHRNLTDKHFVFREVEFSVLDSVVTQLENDQLFIERKIIFPSLTITINIDFYSTAVGNFPVLADSTEKQKVLN